MYLVQRIALYGTSAAAPGCQFDATPRHIVSNWKIQPDI